MTDKLNLNLKNCYGIESLEAELEFKHRGYAIYAPNGVMKTSLAKTMMDISKGNSPSDLVFPERESVHDIKLNEKPINPEDIFVVKSYDEHYSPDGVSTLLANDELKKRYEEVHKDIGEAKKSLDKELRSFAGFGSKSKQDLEPIIEGIFNQQYYDSLLSLEDELKSTEDADFGNADYKIIFDPKVIKFLTSDNIAETVSDFAKKYNELTETSPILKNEFQYHHVSKVQQQLKDNNFFNAGHSINLNDKNRQEKTEITTNDSFLEKIENEKTRILSDNNLRKKFEAFNSKVTNKELVAFRDHITQNQHLLPELEDLEDFKRKLWIQYIHKAQDKYDLLISKYKSGQVQLASIVAEARADPSDWDTVIQDFNRRFLHLPFRLSVKNKSDVILKNTAPSIEFNFTDDQGQRTYAATQRNDLLSVLSTGEARALYILNIMFEIHTRWKIRKKTLFVFDDLADSFDYKNKFAIIDYLEYVVTVEDTGFLAIILTHNFDFLRTIESRKICPAHQCRMAFKNNGKITLKDFKQSDLQNPFQKWQGRLTEAVIQIAYIPFLRNVIEYTQGKKNEDNSDNANYLTLTRMLHYKNDTDELKINDYKIVFEETFPNVRFPDINPDLNILEHIFKTADECLNADDGINLEHKIVLSIAIRIQSDKYIIKKIQNTEPSYNPEKKQTGKLVQDFKERFNNQTEEISLMKRINLMTPSNIHINAFMYEPILDMGFGELKSLYQEVKILLSTTE